MNFFYNTLIIMLIGLTHKDLLLGTYLGCMYELVNYFRLGINKSQLIAITWNKTLNLKKKISNNIKIHSWKRMRVLEN
jgi:hypothetical protein